MSWLAGIVWNDSHFVEVVASDLYSLWQDMAGLNWSVGTVSNLDKEYHPI